MRDYGYWIFFVLNLTLCKVFILFFCTLSFKIHFCSYLRQDLFIVILAPRPIQTLDPIATIKKTQTFPTLQGWQFPFEVERSDSYLLGDIA